MSWSAFNATAGSMEFPGNYTTDVTTLALPGDNITQLGPAPDVANLQLPDTTTLHIVMTISYAVVFLFGVIGNVLVIFVICKNPDMSTTTNIFLINLSIADLLVLLVCMPIGLIDLYAKDVWLLGSFMCKFAAFLEITVTNASVMTILAISFERYYAICRPLEVLYTCTKSRAVKIIISIWLFSAVSASPFFVISYTELSVFHDQTVKLVCRSLIDTSWKHVYNWAIFVVFFLLPSAMLTILYTHICRELLRSQRGLAQPASAVYSQSVSKDADKDALSANGLSPGQPQFGSNLRSHYAANRSRVVTSRRQVIYMLIAVIVFSFSCLLPFRILTLWIVYSSRTSKAKLGVEAIMFLIHVSRILFYMNSAGNPILYNMMSTKFREASKRSVKMICSGGRLDRSDTFRSRNVSCRRMSCRRYESSTKAEIIEYESTSPLTNPESNILSTHNHRL